MTSISQSWEVIANYESHDLIGAAFQARFNRTANTGQRREIASSFIQARRYYQAASIADRAIKPLLIYYGVVSLSKGLTLFLRPGLRETSLAASHGLSTKDWQSVISQPAADIGQLKIITNSRGTFCDLVRATDNRNLNRGNSSAVNSKQTLGPIPENVEITMETLLSRLPDVTEQFRRWKVPACLQPNIEVISGSSESRITIARNAPYITADWAIDVIGGPAYCSLLSEDASGIVLQTVNGGHTSAAITDYVSKNFLGIGDLYLAKQFAAGVNLSKVGQLFAISYVLSMLVRYHSTFWMDLMHQRIGDASIPTIFAAIDCLETTFPQIIVDFLEEK